LTTETQGTLATGKWEEEEMMVVVVVAMEWGLANTLALFEDLMADSVQFQDRLSMMARMY
jgi:hypothetical protein